MEKNIKEKTRNQESRETIPDSIKKMMIQVKEKLKEQDLCNGRGKESAERLGALFENCYTNTLNTTVKKMEDGSTYVITGDIPAMWLRDSTAQLRPYLLLAKEDPEIGDLISGLVKRQFHYINIDPYANAFNEEANGNCWEKDETEQNPWVWERKYEIDSLCYPLQLAWMLWKQTGRTDHLGETFQNGARKILQVFRKEQNHEEDSSYRFIRRNTYFTDTLSREGKGALVKSGVGMTWSGFRPSDDACVYGYLIPSNMFAVVVLRYLEEIAEKVLNERELAEEAAVLAVSIQEGIEQYGITRTEAYGDVYAYETDGFGQYNLMDDANVPSLLSMDYIGYRGKNKAVAENTRKLILSETNPYYYTGNRVKGIGSSHTPPRYIWHISLAMQGLTAGTKEEKREILELLLDTDGGKNCMHEGFHADDPTQYTREWFSWANAMFCELVMDYCGYRINPFG